jgi:hypothetical protein
MKKLDKKEIKKLITLANKEIRAWAKFMVELQAKLDKYEKEN